MKRAAARRNSECASTRGVVMIAALALGAALPALAVTTGIPAEGLPTASHYSAALLPEREGIVAWRTLAEVKTEQVGIQVIVHFPSEVLALDQMKVKLQGFMIPLEAGDGHKRFLLSAVPPECPFCMPAGPEALVEIVAKKAVRFGQDPIVVSGRFSVLKDDDGGMFYRLTDAEAIGPAAPTPAPDAATKARK
jgi:hypothetical protein